MKKIKILLYKILKYLNHLKYTLHEQKIDFSNIPEKHFIILITAFNNTEYVKKCLESSINQNYENFNIIYIDDYSTDGSYEIAKNILHSNKKSNIKKNEKRCGKLENLFRIIHQLDDNSIIIELDGDDFLANKNVLKIFNYYYSKYNYLSVYANYKNIPEFLALNIGHFCQETPFFTKINSSFRKYPWIYSGLRSYYVKLFKQIKQNDLMANFEPYKNKFIPVFHDAATFYPIIEMSGSKIGYIHKKLLLRNINSPLNDFKAHNQKIKNLARKQVLNSKKYEKLI